MFKHVFGQRSTHQCKFSCKKFS